MLFLRKINKFASEQKKIIKPFILFLLLVKIIFSNKNTMFSSCNKS